jgi:hypothetical protein
MYPPAPMNRRSLYLLLGALALGGAVWGAWWWSTEQSEQLERDARAREAAREERRERRQERLRDESQRLMPELLEGVYLGMPLEDAHRARPRMTPALASDNPEERDTVVFEERFPNGARAMYVFTRQNDRLQRVQVLSLLPTVDALAPHLAAMIAQYGTPTGIWDCPNTGGVPTRRFTWRHGETTVSDVMLLYGGRVSVTLYVAPSAIIGRSLRMGACRPVESREQLEQFPTATPEQVESAGR